MKRTLLLILVLLFLFATEILRVYFIMPFPGSQRSNTIQAAYFINKYAWWLRGIGLFVLLPFIIHVFRNEKRTKKIIFGLIILLYGVVSYLVNFRFLADKMFYQPENKMMVPVVENKVDSTKLIIGTVINGEARAYPIEVIGYHHQVQDTIGGQPVMVTYCTVCRSGRIFSPFVNGRLQHFRLVGMDHFNAMFEDEDSKSWWRQATGIAAAGPLKGMSLRELPSQQMRLGAWVRQYPNSLVLQPDPHFKKEYKDLEGFDAGNMKSSLEKRDSASWKFKSWVIGVVVDGIAKAYDWNELEKPGFINDTLNGKGIILVIEKDHASFHVWSSRVNEHDLQFSLDKSTQTLEDTETHSRWNMDGLCTNGAFKGNRLTNITAYQEFWHSWQGFHRGTEIYKTVKN